MKYLVMADGENNKKIFLVDRRVYKSKWWTTNSDLAMKFYSYEAAKTQAEKLRFKNPTVVNQYKAGSISNEQFYGIIL